MPKLAAGVIGAGAIGNEHLAGYASSNLCEIKAICDVNPKRLAEMGEKYCVPVERRFKDFADMLDSVKLDLVSVCTPNVYHYPAAAATIGRGIPTLIEKPMVTTLEDARRLKALTVRKKAKVMVAFSHRFFQANIAAKKLIDKGGIGRPFMIRVRYAHRGPYPGWAQSDWFYKRKLAAGGALLDMGIHAIDICQYLIGPIKSVSANLRTLRKKIEVDDNAVVMLDFGPQAGCLGYIECGWTSPPGFSGIEIYGDKGTLILDLVNGPKYIHGVTRPDGTVETVVEPLKMAEGLTHWPLQMDSWVKYVAGKKTVTGIPGIAEGIASLTVALAADESSRTGKRIVLK